MHLTNHFTIGLEAFTAGAMNCKKGCLIVKLILCKRPNFQQDNLTIDEENDKLPWVKQLSLPNNGECVSF